MMRNGETEKGEGRWRETRKNREQQEEEERPMAKKSRRKGDKRIIAPDEIGNKVAASKERSHVVRKGTEEGLLTDQDIRQSVLGSFNSLHILYAD
jgi:hypothetical protein